MISSNELTIILAPPSMVDGSWMDIFISLDGIKQLINRGKSKKEETE
jgi:hypothetical protein